MYCTPTFKMSIFAEGFISPTSSLEDLSSDNNDQKTSSNRAKWKCPAVVNSSSKMLEKLKYVHYEKFSFCNVCSRN